MGKALVSVIILTYNEEANIRACLESCRDLTEEIFIVDSFSSDKTLGIGREYTDKIYQNAWVHWAHQRNWALDNLPISYEWVLFLDADERLTDGLKQEIVNIFAGNNPSVEGYHIKRNFYFLGRWLKHGGYQADYILRLIKRKQARSIGSGAREYVTVLGKLGRLKNPMIHEDKKDLAFWIDKHNKLARLEAEESIRLESQQGLMKQLDYLEKPKIEHSYRIWLRDNVWAMMPLFIRPLFYFFYRYIYQLGFLDGKEGLIYCFLHGLWYPFLGDAKYFELKKGLQKNIKK
ncbi:MAG: glycosyltransferase family 2 protein [Desulfobaccales bacterium]